MTKAQELGIKQFPYVEKTNNGLDTYLEHKDGFWYKYEHNENGDIIYYEDSNGLITDKRPKQNINNASHNALEDYKLIFALKDIALKSHFPISTLKEVHREVKDVEKVEKIIGLAEELNIKPTNIVTILKQFNL